MERVRRVLICAALVFSVGVQAQWAWRGPLIYPEKLWSDIDLMRSMIHQVHPDPYRYHTRVEIDRLFEALKDSVRRPMDEEGFINTMLPVLNACGDANMRLDRDETSAAALEHTTPLIPFSVRVIDGELYLDAELKGFRSLPVGARVLSINGASSERIVQRIGSLITTDGANETLRWRTMERWFPQLHLRAIDASERYVVKVDSSGTELE
ncbi:MAG TPA: hypothetical protein PK760_02835, partial [Flavobacteriales bacterium]|nr:hypothetical protein [Flavobacteriales bacterium]